MLACSGGWWVGGLLPRWLPERHGPVVLLRVMYENAPIFPRRRFAPPAVLIVVWIKHFLWILLRIYHEFPIPLWFVV